MEMSALQQKNYEIYITSSFPFALSTASIPAVVPYRFSVSSQFALSSGIHNPNHCNQFLCLIGDIENNIIINRHNSCISTLPGLSFILSELLRILSQGKDFSSIRSSCPAAFSGERRSNSLIAVYLACFLTTQEKYFYPRPTCIFRI